MERLADYGSDSDDGSGGEDEQQQQPEIPALGSSRLASDLSQISTTAPLRTHTRVGAGTKRAAGVEMEEEDPSALPARQQWELELEKEVRNTAKAAKRPRARIPALPVFGSLTSQGGDNDDEENGQSGKVSQSIS